MVQIATTVEQSRKLIELGLDPKTSNMYYSLNDEDPDFQCIYLDHYECWDEVTVYDRLCPAWSPDALMEVLPRSCQLTTKKVGDKTLYQCMLMENLDPTYYDSAVEAVFKQVVFYFEHKESYFKTTINEIT